ncbi:hypothetical protein QJS04_geneDACA003017 [Acorus gramineus]|uniref:Uncharacterized protein n=1 Tax=Acorus gramineus TaxID=55184 RepID=A0AAV9BX05_ACOGR|nr:hypothetical protein QJS04_geneDACA003017 [Acorus gramineus]
MEPERNNKRPRNGAVDGGERKTRSRVTEAAVKDPPQPSVAAEEEVEEFFAILRRMREAARLIGGGGRIGCPPMCFRSEDFDVAKKGEVVEVLEAVEAAVVAVKEEEEGVVTSSLLDLNVEPEPGPV